MRKNLHLLQANDYVDLSVIGGVEKRTLRSHQVDLVWGITSWIKEKKILQLNGYCCSEFNISMQQLAGRLEEEEEEQENAIKLASGDTLLSAWKSMSVDINSGVVKSQPPTPLVGFRISLWSVTVADTPATVTDVRCLFSKLRVCCLIITQRSVYRFYSDVVFQVWLQCATQAFDMEEIKVFSLLKQRKHRLFDSQCQLQQCGGFFVT